MKKKLLTLDDLVQFCQSQKLYSFNSKESGYQLCVQTPATFKKDQEEDEESSLLYATVTVMHTGRNRNKSNVTVDAAKKAMKNMAYKPILANFAMTESGELDFTSHDFTVNDDGEVEYQEHQIGCFTADDPYMEQDPDNEDRQYVYATCAIPKEYTAAADIIERKNGTKVSVELIVNSMEYNAADKELLLTDVEVSGLTCLGTDPETGREVQEGMEGARLDIADFSVEKNSVCFDRAIEIMQGLKESLDNYITAHAESMKGGNEMETFDENVEVSEEEVVLAEEETAAAEVAETEESEAESEETTPEEDSEEEEKQEFSKTITYSVSVSEMLSALTNLVNETYSGDGTYYMVDCYSDSKELIMIDMWSGTAYKQSYSVKKDVYSLKGDRVPVKAVYVTADEEAELDRMRGNYAEISDKLAKYEAEPEKMEILESADYSSISESDEFVAFKAQDAHFDLSVEEVRAKADEMLLNAAKQGKVDFAQAEQPKKEIGMKKLPIDTKGKRSGRYGGLFNK